MNVLISGNYNAFADGFNGAGVYLASGIYPSQTFRLPVYYGGTDNLHRRICREHIPELLGEVHHNLPLQRYVTKHGHNALVWFLVEPCQTEDASAKEQQWLDKERPYADERRGFNIARDASAPMRGRKHSEEARRKIALANMGKKHSAATKEKMSAWQIGKTVSPDTRKRISEANAGKKRTPEQRQRASLAAKGKTLSAEHRARIGEANRRRKLSDATKQKISAALRAKRSAAN